MLRVENLNAWYGHSHAVQGISFMVGAGEIVTIMGRNGAGKTTTLRTIMGLVAKRSGNVWFDGAEILAGPAHTRFRRGLGYVPEDRRIVPGLTVRENLRLGLLAMPGGADEEALVEHVTRTFPRLKERLDQEGTSLSGGEQQMLAIARAMMSKPRMILLDEPSEGIMPLLVQEMFQLFREMKKAGTTILLVEQNVERALSISDRAYIMDHGVIVHHDTAANLLADRTIQERYCAV
jgi:branched-chain amino acid transport system ATP-binding protein